MHEDNQTSIRRDPSSSVPAIVSVHDVTPQTLPVVIKMLNRLERLHIHTATLLVVPGAGWSPVDVSRLRDLQQKGYHLAGHGWIHGCSGRYTLKHKVHALLMSRNVAEHLSQAPGNIANLILRCFGWFHTVGLAPPDLYVPPAWAMGRISRNTLNRLPFKWYESLTGIYDAENGTFHRLLLLGYEADTWLRKLVLKISNRIHQKTASAMGFPIRVAIHPFDLDRRLSADLMDFLKKHAYVMSYADLLMNLHKKRGILYPAAAKES